MLDDTIAAISTPIGAAGIGIVRMSGENALKVAERVFRSKKAKSISEARNRSILYGHIVDEKETVVDEVLVSVMRGPGSFTAEDVVEINCHGGVVAVRKTLELVLRSGARMAEPGEFSKRAFLNGRIDLAQAESIIDLINAKTEKSLKVAVDQLDGILSSKIKNIDNKLLGVIAQIEAGIDFPEHDVEEISRQEIKKEATEVLDEIEELIESAQTGKVFREGLKTVIIGKPNVGKSSLLNALLKEKRAIVTDIPGTTRDIIEEIVSIRGIPLKLVDTAGIRETEDIVEKIGVQKTKEIFAEADLVLLMIDASTGLTEEDRKLVRQVETKNSLVLVNKTDISNDFETKDIEDLLKNVPIIKMSLLTGEGLDVLEKEIEELVYAGISTDQDQTMVTNVRHKSALEKSAHSIRDVLQALDDQMPLDCLSIDIRAARDSLGEITGETIGEDLIDQIFNRFCIGK